MIFTLIFLIFQPIPVFTATGNVCLYVDENVGYVISVLEAKCSLLDNSIYFRGSCYIKTTDRLYHPNEDPVCNHIVGANNYDGHAAFILDSKTANTVKSVLPELDGTRLVHAYIGGEGNRGLYRWMLADGESWPFTDDFKSRMFVDKQDRTDGVQGTRVSLFGLDGKIHDWDPRWAPATGIYHAFICQYREKDLCFIKAIDNKKGSDLAMIDGPIDADGTDCADVSRDTPVCQSFSHDEEKCTMYTYMSGDMELQDAPGFMLCEKP